MENKYVGYMLLGISLIIIVIIFMFKHALTDFVDASCTLAHNGEYCPMYDTISQQTYLALAIVGILILVGISLVLSKSQEKVIVQTRTIEKKPQKKIFDTHTLTSEEKKVFTLIQTQKTVFQADLIERTGLRKAKMTRILDRLEGRNFVERKRRGMMNVVVLKQ